MRTSGRDKAKKPGKTRTRFGTAVELWRFQLLAVLIMIIPASVLDRLLRLLVNSTGNAITTANLKQLLNWKTPIILVLGLLLIFVFIVIEILAQIYLDNDLLTGKDGSVFRVIGRGFRAVRKFLTPKGLLVVLYITLAVPLCGIGFSISLTESFYIPHFITGVIFSRPLLTVLYAAGIAALAFIGFRQIFTLHAMLLDDMSAKDAQKKSIQIIKSHVLDFLKKIALMLLYSVLILAAAEFLTDELPALLTRHMGEGLPAGYEIDIRTFENVSAMTDLDRSVLGYRLAGALSIFLAQYVKAVIYMLVSGNALIQLTKLYFRYTGRAVQPCIRSKRRWMFLVSGFIVVPVLIAAVSCLLGLFYNQIPIFSRERVPLLVAHRTGGIMASENSLEGIDESVKRGVYGSETDIQRTKDGAYVINHDDSFKRLTGVAKKPGELTLEEVKELRIKDTTGSGALLEVPTYEELLDRCRGRITPFIELKGVSADKKMADDAVAAVRERNMTDEAVIISLNYSVMDYVEQTYPEFETGVLIFAGLGDVSKMNCDMIIMEEEMSTLPQILQIHEAGKKAAVWTVNTGDGLRHFLDSDADCIITDEIPLAIEIRQELADRTDVELMEDRIKNLL